MNNISKISEALTEWGMNVAKSALPQLTIPPTSTIGKMMGFLGVDVKSYSIYDELGFILEPTIKIAVEPMINQYLGAFSDDKVKEMAFTYAKAFRRQATEKGYVNLFGIQLGESAFAGLEEILTNKLGHYEIS